MFKRERLSGSGDVRFAPQRAAFAWEAARAIAHSKPPYSSGTGWAGDQAIGPHRGARRCALQA
ncbi:MAG TPA: hypothetical protein VFX12_11255 [Vicinamibacterales bacterium]|nr:hypothetical protein [Vicinamibacterales bacterium]